MESLAPEWEYSWQPQPGSRKNWDYLWVQRSWSNWFFKILRQLDSAILFVSPLCVFSRQTRHFVARCKGIQTAGTSFLSWGRIKSQRSICISLGWKCKRLFWSAACPWGASKKNSKKTMGIDAMEIQGVEYWVLEARKLIPCTGPTEVHGGVSPCQQNRSDDVCVGVCLI